MVRSLKPVLEVLFYRSETGRDPVREWIRSLGDDARYVFGKDLKIIQFDWPIGMPLVRSLGGGLWEMRSQPRDGIGRILFIIQDGTMVILHGFIKKSRKIPQEEIDLARKRANLSQRGRHGHFEP
jgi:phage-related protein